MSEAEEQAYNRVAPISSATAGVGVAALTTSVTAASVAVPAALQRRYVDLCAEGADIYVLFSEAAVTIDKTASGSTFAAGTTTAVPVLLKDGVPQPFRLDGLNTLYLNHQAASGTPKLRVWPSSQKTMKDQR